MAIRKLTGAILALFILISCSSSLAQSGGEMVPKPPSRNVGELVIVNRQQIFSVNPEYYTIWSWLHENIREASPTQFQHIQWFWADSIKSPEGWLAYGATAWGPPLRIYLEREYQEELYIPCHEMVHVITGGGDENHYGMYMCEHGYLERDLPVRYWKPQEALTPEQ
jgi:hypothetical protein